MHHRDPFDHLLIAQAIAEDATFISDDRHAPRYPVRLVTCSEPPLFPAEWLHKAEEAAIGCMDLASASDTAFTAIRDGRPSNEWLMAFEAAVRRHNEACERLNDIPLLGQEIRELRERIVSG
jgi:hypothetical protein